ncbi:CHAP domain-containing protein [Carbonactinospora thermoautotrophica]|uniref:Putative choline binding protein n=1 Tax=Carbonactinospora thermoautotrophica TaxID=1469144 RepID=A0A132MKS2_9ACTN|nr:CHAP domain-containing protein [Carbonactinospora thermoautotrophica]KWW98426.1 putative choline binding protein [Carbonactinospora thermoautotrophica]
MFRSAVRKAFEITRAEWLGRAVRRVAAVVVTATFAATAILAGAQPTLAAPAKGQVDGPSSSGAQARRGPGTVYKVAKRLPEGRGVNIVCTTSSQPVRGTYGTSTIWNRLDNGRWVPDANVYTGTNERTRPECPGTGRRPSGDDYPYSRSYGIDRWAMYTGECTSFVAWRMEQVNGYFHNHMWRHGKKGHWGNAAHWNDNAKKLGYRVDRTPRMGAIAYWEAGKSGASRYGHVGYVVSVSSDGKKVTIEEYNWGKRHGYGKRTIPVGNPSGYIHLAPGT